MCQSAGLLEQRQGGLDTAVCCPTSLEAGIPRSRCGQVLAGHLLPVSSRGLSSVCPHPWRLLMPQSLLLIKDTSQIG